MRHRHNVIALSIGLWAASWGLAQDHATREYARQVAQQVSAQEWLGPIASVALSPFFGLSCLSGLATYGPDWVRERSVVLGVASPMNNPWLFWTMAGLTLVTSLPRLTKLSKPVALVAENLETYSALIILLVMKFSSGMHTSTGDETLAMPLVMVQAGIGSFSVDLLLSFAAAINLIVINTVKLAAEFFVWLIPIPFVDSLVEIANKSLCAALAGLYAYSPTLAAIVNLILFVSCAMVFLKVTRYLHYFKSLYFWPVIRAALGKDESKEPRFPAFPVQRWRGIPARSQWWLNRLDGNRFEVVYRSWFAVQKLGIATLSSSAAGMLTDRLHLILDGETVEVEIRKGAVIGRTAAVLPT